MKILCLGISASAARVFCSAASSPWEGTEVVVVSKRLGWERIWKESRHRPRLVCSSRGDSKHVRDSYQYG